MIAPFRQTEPALDEKSQLIARARRAAALALLRNQPPTPTPPATDHQFWKSWLFAAWAGLVAVAAVVGGIFSWWNGIDY